MYCCVRGFTRRSQHYTRQHSLPILPRDSHWGYWSLQTVGLHYHTSLGGHCSYSHHCRHYIHCMPKNQPKETKRKSKTYKIHYYIIFDWSATNVCDKYVPQWWVATVIIAVIIFIACLKTSQKKRKGKVRLLKYIITHYHLEFQANPKTNCTKKRCYF